MAGRQLAELFYLLAMHADICAADIYIKSIVWCSVNMTTENSVSVK